MATGTNISAVPSIRDLIRTGIGVPIGVLAVLSMVVLPLPPMILDMHRGWSGTDRCWTATEIPARP